MLAREDDRGRVHLLDDRRAVQTVAGEESLESAEHQHGYFTLALVEGLRGEAANTQGVVYLADVYAYVTQRVKTLTSGQQHPVIHLPIRSLPLMNQDLRSA